MSDSQALLELQAIDQKLLRASQELKRLEHDQNLAIIVRTKKKLQQELRVVLGRRKDLELECADIQQSMDHYHKKRAEVLEQAHTNTTTYRDLQSFEQQMSSLDKHIEKSTFQLKPLQAKLKKIREHEQKLEAALPLVDNKYTAREQQLHTQQEELLDQLNDLMYERSLLRMEFSSELLERYDMLQKRFGYTGVERLSGNIPSVCRVQLQPSTFHEVMHGPNITECPYCHRMLLTEGALS